MRVTMLNKYYPPHLGGIEYHMRDLAEQLATMGHDVDALVSNESSETVSERINDVGVTRLARTVAYSSTPIAPGMSRAIRALESAPSAPDVLHLHFPYPWGEVSWLRARTSIPTVMTYHSDIVRQKLGLAAYRPLLERVLDRVDLIIASSPNMVEHSEFLKPRAEKCRVVPFGIHVEKYATTPAIEARAAELRKPHADHPVILFVGRLIYYKGADVLVRAMASVDAHLVMIGSGPLEGRLREIAAAHGMTDRITFLGPQSDEDLVAWYHAADVFCLPSVARSEAFGLVQIESHASGTPVVSTSLTTGVPYANADGLTGLVVPPGDERSLAQALSTLVDDSELRHRLGEQARERAVRDFSIPRMAQQTVGVYHEAMGEASA